MRLRIGVAVLITAVNISVYCIWVPARLQVSERYIYINDRWDRCEKVIYLCVDGALNWYFMHIVRKRLVDQGRKIFPVLTLFLSSRTCHADSVHPNCLLLFEITWLDHTGWFLSQSTS
jgi:hypothetical protein